MQSGQASAKVKRAVCHGATRCPYEKGLGAAHGQVTTETKLGLELGASLPLWPPSSSLALPHPNYPWAAILAARTSSKGAVGRAERGMPAATWDVTAQGCSQPETVLAPPYKLQALRK